MYEFGLDRAIGFCLVPYSYYVHACTLNRDELDEFKRLSRRLGTAMGARATEEDTGLQRLLIARRRIIETGQSKIDLLREVLNRRGPRDLEHALIYASAKNPEQFDDIGRLLTALGVKWAPVTQDTTRNPKPLARILDSFARGAIQVLLAKKVLDEGVDIPSIREAFIVASSTVEREWVQRRGRILRRHPGKPWAIVHDFLALPPARLVRGDGTRGLKKIIETELNRTYAFGRYAPKRRRCRRRARRSGAGHYRLLAGSRRRNGHPEHRRRACRRQCDAEREAMVSNFERILNEIKKEAHRSAGTYGLEPESVVNLIMEIVDLEDQHRVKSDARINQRFKGLIENAARSGTSKGDV